MTLYQDESFQFEYSGQPEFGGCSSVGAFKNYYTISNRLLGDYHILNSGILDDNSFKRW
jgi:hypothetical protein